MAAYGQMERVNPSHGYHWRAYDAIGGENITNTPPPAPSPPLGLSPALQTHTSTFLISSPPRSRRGTNWDKRLKHTDAEPYEGGVRVTPPPLLKNSPQEAPGNKEGWQGEFHTTPQMYLIAFRRARAAVRTGTSGLDKRRWDRMKVACA